MCFIKMELIYDLYENIADLNIRKVKEILRDNEADINQIIPGKGINVFHLAVGIDPVDFSENVTKMILKNGGNPNKKSDEGLTPLHIAAAWGREKIVELLLCFGADPYVRDEEFKTPLDYASENHHINVINILLDYIQNDRYQLDNSPDKYSIKLDKVFINNGSVKGEYEIDEDNEEDLKSMTDSFRKSVYIKKWCESSGKFVNNASSDSEQEIVKNKYGDIMFKKPFYCLEKPGEIETCNLDMKKIFEEKNTSTHSEYHTCCDDLKFESETMLSQNNNKLYEASVEKEIASNLYDSGSLSGINTIKFTRNEENEAYSVLHKQTLNGNETCTNSPSRLSSFTFSGSPVSKPHKNYSTKTTLRTRNNDEIKYIDETPVKLTTSEEKMNTDEVISDVDRNPSICVDETIIEQYKYEDREAGVVLIENRLVSPSTILTVDLCDKSVAPSIVSSASSLPLSMGYDSNKLRCELANFGINPGPITPTTKRIYLKKLHRLQKQKPSEAIQHDSSRKTYTVELEKTLHNPQWNLDLSRYMALEDKIVKQFEIPDSKMRWREGLIKSSFTYLLLDPRITDNLPVRSKLLSPSDLWRTFLDSIFYIGKGKRSRPYSHLYEAVTIHNSGKDVNKNNKKVQHILDIWKEKLGVVCLHVFQNVIPVEAYTREAAMIEVVGLKNVKNIKPGNYYGVATTWCLKEKKQLGLYLLYRAMLIFLNEGERQLRPDDIC